MRDISIKRIIVLLLLLTAYNVSQTAVMSDYDLLVSVFGKHLIDLHDDLGVELLEGETWVMTSTNAHIISTEEQARELAEDIYTGDSFTLSALDIIGENDSFFAFRLSGVFSFSWHPDEYVLHRVMIQKDWQNTEKEHLYRYREDVIQRLEEVIGANINILHRKATLKRLTIIADEMNAVWGIWDGWSG